MAAHDWIVPWKELPRPPDWEALFGRRAPLEVEIGFGVSGYLIQEACSRPESNLVGIEADFDCVRKVARKLADGGPANIRLLKADAEVALERLFRPRSLHGAYALFPDPWPKRRHQHHRLFSRSFLRLLNSRLEEGAKALVVTDDRSYSRWISGQVDGTGFDLREELAPPRFDTRYERQWHEQGKEHFHQLVFQKREHVEVPLLQDVELREVRLPGFDPGKPPTGEVRGRTVVQFKKIAFDAQSGRAHVVAVVVEGRLLQNVWIEVRRKGDYWTVGLDPSRSRPVIPTEGVQRALELVSRTGCR